MKFGHQLKAGDHSAGGAGQGGEGWYCRPVILSLVLVAVTVMAYWPVRLCGFLGYDDPLYYTANRHVLGGFAPENIAWAFTTGEAANWHPVTWLSHMLDAELFGKNAAGPHLMNLVFHAANVVLVFLVLRRLTAAYWRSAAVALLFAVHPLHVESVAWVAERKDLLCAFFVLLALLFYVRYVALEKDGKAGARKFYFLCLASFALGLMSKPMAVTLPFVLLLLDWWPLNRVRSSEFARLRDATARQGIRNVQRLFVEKLPFLAASFVVSAVTVVVQSEGGAVQTLASFPLSMRFENTFVSYAQYLGKIIWPQTLATPYPPPEHWPVSVAALCAGLFLGLSVGALWLARKWPAAFTGWFWFAGMLVPVIGLVQVGTQAMADRYVYLPMVGVLVAAVWGLAALARNCHVPGGAALVVLVIVAGGYDVKTRAQLAYWHDDGALFGHTLAVTENNYTAHVDLGSWLSQRGANAEALAEYTEALRIKPGDASALYNAGNALARMGRLDEAMTNYLRALQAEPDKPEVLNNLGFALMRQERFQEAITNYQAALKIKPDYADVHNNLATALFREGQFEDAAQEFFTATQLEPENPVFYSNLGDAMARLGRQDKAAECYRKALALDPGNSKLENKARAFP